MFSTSRVNLKQIQDAACAELSKLLDHHIDGNKLIVMDEFIMGPLNLVTNTQYFSERNIKLMKLGSDLKLLPAREFPNVIFLVRPQVHVMELIYQLFKHSENDTKGRIYHLFFVPRRSCVCMKYLENKGVYGKFSMNEELPWNFYVLDTDVLSMELPNAFKDLTVNGDPTVLYQAALGLISIQKHFGCIPKIYGKGNYAQRIWEFAKQLGREEKVLVSSGGEKGFIDQLIILDRSTDVLSALATQLTYQGLIDDFYGIKQNQVKLPAVVFSRSSSSNDTNSSSDYSPTLVASEEMRSIILNSSDKLYLQLRDKNFNEVGRILTRNAKEISQQMNPSDKDKMHVMKQLVDNLQSLLAQKQSVGMHTTIAEQIRAQLDDYAFSEHLEAEQDFMVCKDNDRPSPYIEDLIAQKEDLKNVLRLMCIQCVASSGFKDKVLNYYKRELVSVYGIDVLLILSSLEKAGLIHSQTEARSYAVLRKTLNLTVEGAVEVDPIDISYVHSFYAPLSIRLIEHLLRPLGWQSLKSKISSLPGVTFEDFQAQLIGIGGRQQSATPCEGSLLNVPRIIMVFFVGGCTSAEIAALRFLSQQEDNNVEFIIATTNVINKNSIVESFMENC